MIRRIFIEVIALLIVVVRLFCFNKNVVVSFVLNMYNNMSLHVIVFTGLKNGEVKHSVYGAANLSYRSFYVGPQSYNGEKCTSHISHVKLLELANGQFT